MNNHKKIIVAMVTGAILTTLTPYTFSAGKNPAATSVQTSKLQKNYYPVIVNNHIGFMDQSGKITKTNYNFSYLFDENIQVQDGLFPFSSQNGYMGFIDISGKVVIKPDYPVLGSLSDGMLMFRTMTKTKGQMLSGYMTEGGKIVSIPQFTYGSSFSEGLAKVYINQTDYGYINKLGQWAIKPQFKSVSVTDGVGTFHEGRASFRISNSTGGYSWGFIDTKGNAVIKPVYSFAVDFHEGLARVEQNGKSGYIDKNGVMVIKPTFTYSNNFSEGIASFSENGKTGYIDKTGKVIIKPQFSDASDFKEGIASGILDGKLCFFDKSGKVLFKTDYRSATNFNGGVCVVNKDRLYGVIDKTGKVIVKPQYRYMNEFVNGLSLAMDSKNYRLYINTAGKIVWKSQAPIMAGGQD